MGQAPGKEEHIRRITDRVFEYFAQKAATGKLSFPDLYTAVLLVYNDLNKHFPRPHYDPPSREEVHALFEKFDKNADNELSKEEFALFMEKFTSEFIGRVSKAFFIFSIIAPALAFFAKQATEGLPRIGKFVQQIPTPIYASLVTALFILGESLYRKKWKA
ncbi:hypothetical protein GOP47_0016630 [Adiantum capillus-veneris]|uniref:EF-hand domain-containing protein n=1 Tax=Adiantum capillus-veneris TaxID=13818 RepID=A0A9D4UI27_ADICA|nr:hypothetical protein GOP47_0016630 [Adiantum capillus-veneris]